MNASPSIQGAESSREPTAKMGFLALLYALPVMFVFWLFFGWQRAFAVLICTTTVFFVVSVFWNLRRHVWFWITIGFAFLLQIPFVLLIPWANFSSHFSAFPFALLDYFLVYGCVRL